MAGDGFDVGGAFGQLNNIMAQGYSDRAQLLRQRETDQRARDLAAQVDARQREMQQEQFGNQEKLQNRKLAAELEMAKLAANGKNKSESGFSPKEVSNLRRDALKSKEAQNSQAILKMKSSLDNYEKLVKQHGYQPIGSARGEIENAYADLQIQAKEAANLGALTGPDMAILENMIKPVTGMKAYMGGEAFTGGIEGVQKGLSQMQQSLRMKSDINLKALRKAYPEAELSDLINELAVPAAPVVNPQAQAAGVAQWLQMKTAQDPQNAAKYRATAQAKLQSLGVLPQQQAPMPQQQMAPQQTMRQMPQAQPMSGGQAPVRGGAAAQTLPMNQQFTNWMGNK